QVRTHRRTRRRTVGRGPGIGGRSGRTVSRSGHHNLSRSLREGAHRRRRRRQTSRRAESIRGEVMTEPTPKLTDAELREMADWLERTNKENREGFLLALAELALARPRFDHSLGLIADEMFGRALFEQVNRLGR